MKKIYLASPFFDDGEIERVNKVKDILREKGLDVFVPMEHQNKHLEFGSLEWREATFTNDVKHIDWCDVVVSIVGKNYEDSGTCWELGYAYATNKPFIVVNIEKGTINLMISDSLHAYLDSYEKLESYDFDKLEKIKYENYVW